MCMWMTKVRNYSLSAAKSTKSTMSSASERNKQPILEILQKLLPTDRAMNALEIASGYGTHVSHFAQHFPNIKWQPTDYDQSCVRNIQYTISKLNVNNVLSPLIVDVSKPVNEWPIEVKDRIYDLMLCINMIHITPFACTQGLFNAAGRLLKDKGLLVTYGPYAVNGVLRPASNVNFDRSLRQQNPLWGVRDVNQLDELAFLNGLKLEETFEMPANNKTLVFRKGV
ncbi:UPF0585 protein C16orf13-like protein [Dinothrombium tinctorium]|uniref:UPF0585 protein C16orf13-like protein n=1 Tax=Dinothrombium tinctorium TaxID=1965070 RepID=A0A443QL28_9ACAR|nr:UPF0585 protein C16orf13-like protein [Dinothrombium tinctorium]